MGHQSQRLGKHEMCEGILTEAPVLVHGASVPEQWIKHKIREGTLTEENSPSVWPPVPAPWSKNNCVRAH